MAFFRVNFGIVGKADGGSALRRSAYQRCVNSDGFDFSSKAHEFVHNEIMMPQCAPENFTESSNLWHTVEAAEKRCDAQLSRTIDFAIPHEIPEELRNDFARDVLQFYVDKGFGLEWTRHKAEHLFSDSFSDTVNDHIHAQITLRTISESGLNSKKDRAFNSYMRKRNGRQAREDFAERINSFFEKNNIKAEVTAEQIDNPVIDIPKNLIYEYNRKKAHNEKPENINNQQQHSEQLVEYLSSRHNTIKQRERNNRNEKETTNSKNSNSKIDFKRDQQDNNPRNSEKSGDDSRNQRNSSELPGTDRSRAEPRRAEQDRRTAGADSPGTTSNERTSSSSRAKPDRSNQYLQAIQQRIKNAKFRRSALKQHHGHADRLSQISQTPPADFPVLESQDVNNFLKKWAQSTQIGMRM
jgi:hypothetical protein